jgi:hypothetical protein
MADGSDLVFRSSSGCLVLGVGLGCLFSVLFFFLFCLWFGQLDTLPTLEETVLSLEDFFSVIVVCSEGSPGGLLIDG